MLKISKLILVDHGKLIENLHADITLRLVAIGGSLSAMPQAIQPMKIGLLNERQDQTS